MTKGKTMLLLQDSDYILSHMKKVGDCYILPIGNEPGLVPPDKMEGRSVIWENLAREMLSVAK